MTRPSRDVALSIVVPVHDGALFIEERLVHLSSFLHESGLSYEIIVVDDGSIDGTFELIERLGQPALVPIRLEQNLGKFAALRVGMSQTRGGCCLFTDADIPYETSAILHMAHHVLSRSVHLVIGDRTLPGSIPLLKMSCVRKGATWLFSFFVRTIVTGGLPDTQCGIKALRGDVARALFSVSKESGFAGDVELLYIALKYNLEIKRVPVRLVFQAPSTVRLVRDGLRMISALFRIKNNHRKGLYWKESLATLACQDY